MSGKPIILTVTWVGFMPYEASTESTSSGESPMGAFSAIVLCLSCAGSVMPDHFIARISLTPGLSVSPLASSRNEPVPPTSAMMKLGSDVDAALCHLGQDVAGALDGTDGHVQSVRGEDAVLLCDVHRGAGLRGHGANHHVCLLPAARWA